MIEKRMFLQGHLDQKETCLIVTDAMYQPVSYTHLEGEKVRPVWEDTGESAYTIKRFGVVNRYDLSKEFPALTLRRTALKSAFDEILWIWQKKSNNIHDLNSHIWDSWADEDGSIGKAYGYQLGVKHQYKEGMMDQVDRVLYLSLIHI